MVGRFNRTLEAILSKFVDANQRDWDLHLSLLTLAYWSSKMFGWEVLLPLALFIGQPKPTKSSSKTEYAVELIEQMEQVHQFAWEHFQVSSDHQKNYDHCPVNQYQYRRGPRVAVQPAEEERYLPKAKGSFDGPYLVIKRLSVLVYWIQKGPKSKSKVVHHDRLKAYQDPNVPDWLAEYAEPEQNATHYTTEAS